MPQQPKQINLDEAFDVACKLLGAALVREQFLNGELARLNGWHDELLQAASKATEDTSTLEARAGGSA